MRVKYEYEQSESKICGLKFPQQALSSTLVLHHLGPLTLDLIAMFPSMLTILRQIASIEIEGAGMSDNAKL